MSHEKDKRSSKIFGARLSAIFGDADKGTRGVSTPTSNPKNNLLRQSLLTKSSNNVRPQPLQSNSSYNTDTITDTSESLDHEIDSRSIPDSTRALLEPTTPSKRHETTSPPSANTFNKQLNFNHNKSPLTSPGIGSPQSDNSRKLHRKRPPDIQDDTLPNPNLTPSSHYTSPNYNSNPHSHNSSNRDSNLGSLVSPNIFHPESPESDDFQFNTVPARESFVVDFDNSNKSYPDDDTIPNQKSTVDQSRPQFNHRDSGTSQHSQDHKTKASLQHYQDQPHSSQIKKSLSQYSQEYQSPPQNSQHTSQPLERPQMTHSHSSQLNYQQSNSNSNINDLIDSIENQINYFNIDSDTTDPNISDHNMTDPNSSRRYSKIPRSPNIMQLSDFSDGQKSPVMHLAQLSSNSRTNSPRIEKDSFLRGHDNSRTPTPSDSSLNQNEWYEHSNTSPLKSNISRNSFNFTDSPLEANSKRKSPKKDSFLNFSNPPNDSIENFHTNPIKEFEGLSAKPIDPVDYASENSTSHSEEPSKSSSNEPTLDQISRTLSKMSDLAYGEFKVPEEYKLSSESSHENPIIENNAMISPKPDSFIGSTDIQAPYPISTPGISPPLSPADVQHDFVSREVSIKSTNSSFDRNIESLISRKSSETSQAFPRNSANLSCPTTRTLSYGSKKNILKPVLSTPLESNLSSTQTFTVNHRRQSSSISSIFSSHSNKPANLATIKKGLNLKPGEGERSNYVLLIRRSAGTAYNENGPGKWKLPIGIKPVDKASLATNANGRYKRLAGPFNQNRLKKSGVELKHGHLQPRLLAGEIDDKDTGIRQKIGTIPEVKPVIPETKSASMSRVASGTNLARVATVGSTNTMDVQSIAASSTISSTGIEEFIVSSSSSENINGAIGGGYYQHPGYKYSQAGEDDTEIESGSMDNEDSYEYEERPKLVLANPDVSSDSD